ncbi:MAG: hypothetical protein A3B44_00335 [Candidatus Levybacteria bacterium RIFCSPLOWO2_01_FULL_38_21]|nr:MAG: hypothetical protein A3B44_00335 [Candidatus Levybacteria bacterium RIFCSPLOWO2_01_FULL_38_21]
MVWVLAFLTLAGYNFSFWLIVGIARFLFERIPHSDKRKRGRPSKPILPKDVAAVIPAHNEQRTIAKAIRSLRKILPVGNIYVASDYSTDKTVKIARSFKVKVLDIRPNRGKARALVYIMKRYHLLSRFKAIIIHDADVEVSKDYLKNALPFLKDQNVAAVATHGVTRLKNYKVLERFYITYRLRLWRILQYGMRFGQTWKYTNVTYIIPGSLSLYRTRVLKKLKIDAPDLIIEDFNMTFEVRRKKLGIIAYNPSIFGVHQDPYTFRDYTKQLRRWNLGFWQTVKKNGIWPSLFWLSMGSFLIELLLYTFFILSVPILIFIFILHSFNPISIPLVSSYLTFLDLLIGLFLMDYVLTIIAAAAERKPEMLIYGLGFFFLRYVDAIIYTYTLPLAFLVKSKGTWSSPERK